jgi:dCMP deaminase
MARKPNTVYTVQCVKCGHEFQAKCRSKHPRCTKCVKLDTAVKVRAANYNQRPEYKVKARAWRLMNYYGMTPEQYEALFVLQGGMCAICHNPPLGKENLSVDHDHKTGKVRGLLCQNCNRAIGGLQESMGNLRGAINYLTRHGPKRSWDQYFIQIAEHVATRSKDPATQVGAVLVRERNIISTGYNGFPRGVNDDVPERLLRPTKYLWTVHAEENAILTAGRFGVSTRDTTLYVTPMAPCQDCAKAIIQCGIKEVVFETVGDQTRWVDSMEVSKELFAASGVLVRKSE